MTDRSKVLTLAANLELPLEAATRRLAILAMSGAGKSNVAVVLAEQMADAGIPWVAIDPKGDWWGIRSSKSGKGPGLQIPIIGGSHGDVPLEPGAGKVIADLIHAQRLTCVLDVSEFDERQQLWGFLADFGNELLRLHKRTPQVHHLFLEECDEYIPQKASEKGNQIKCLGVWQRVVKKGRTLGLGSTQITQRNASLNKDTLYMAELLVAMRVTGKGDREAIKGWVDHHNAAAEIVTSLPTLQDGEGWVSSPAWLRETKRVRFHRRRTFDSGSTPVLLEGTAPAATLADVDLEALRTRMAATIEKAKDEDPAELKKRIGDLERQLKAKTPAATSTAAPKVDPAELRQARTDIAELQAHNERLSQALERLMKFILEINAQDFFTAGAANIDQAAMQKVIDAAAQQALKLVEVNVRAQGKALEQWRRQGEQILAGIERLLKREVKVAVNVRHNEPFTVKPVLQTSAKTAAPRTGQDQETNLSRPQQALLDALAYLESVGIYPSSRRQMALVAQVSAASSGFEKNVSTLRTAGLIAYPSDGMVALTDGGKAIARPPESAPTVEELQAAIYGRLSRPQAALLKALVEAYPDGLSREDLGAAAVQSPLSSGFEKNVSTLRSVGLVDYPDKGHVRALPVLFLEGA